MLAASFFWGVVGMWLSYRVLARVREGEPEIWRQWGRPEGMTDQCFAGSLLVQSIVFFTREKDLESQATVAAVRHLRRFFLWSFVLVVVLIVLFRE